MLIKRVSAHVDITDNEAETLLLCPFSFGGA
jgi:hypothetical protein